jgi:large subunit ribosomal protein L9e
MIKGVKYGFRYALKAVYAHFPINWTFNGDKEINIRNFLGEKVVRIRHMLDGVTVKASENKDELYVEVRWLCTGGSVSPLVARANTPLPTQH